jgi:hypothetical protein
MKALTPYLKTDPAFALDVIQSFIKNLLEFRECLLNAIKHQNGKLFLDAHHKMKTTLSYTSNERLQQQADFIKSVILNQGTAAIDARTQNAFCRLCTSSIHELQQQFKNYKAVL